MSLPETDVVASDGNPTEPSTTSAAPSDSKASRRSSRKELPKVSRLQMIEYLNVREWWTKGQTALIFTLLLWGVLVWIIWLRTDVDATFEVNSALSNYVRQVVGHPRLSGVAPRPIEKTPLPCRCACQEAKRGIPNGGECGAADSSGYRAGTFDFIGTVSKEKAISLGLSAGGIDSAPRMDLDRIQSAADVWYWIEHGLLPQIWEPREGRGSESAPGLILRRNLVIGGLRVRQRRVKAAEECKVDSGLQKWYKAKCQSAALGDTRYGPSDTIAFKNDSIAERAFSPVTDVVGAFDAYFWVQRPLSSALQTAGLLRENDWYDDLTLGLEVSVPLINAEVGLYVLLTINFDFLADGSVVQKTKIKSLKVPGGGLEIKDYIPELIWIILILLLLRQEMSQLLWNCYYKRLREYVSDPWNFMDWVSIGVGVPVAFFWYVIALQTDTLTSEVVSLPRSPISDVALNDLRTTWETGVVENLRKLLDSKSYHIFSIFLYTTILTIRFLKNFLTQQKMATIQLALFSALWDVLHFLILYLAVFGNFALGGRILFGHELKDWSGYARATSTSLRVLMGQMDFDEMNEIAPVASMVWIWLFLATMSLLFSNLLLVIFFDHFNSFRTMIGPTPSMFHDAWNGWRDFLWRTEWRIDLIKDGEYRDAIDNPYADLVDELMEKAEVDEDFQKAARASSLGARLSRRIMESRSLEGMGEDGNAGGVVVEGIDLRRLGADPATALHLIEECGAFVEAQSTASDGQLDQVRQMVSLLKKHNVELDAHCTKIENGIDDDKFHLWQILKRLEQSVRFSLESFAALREVGADTLIAPLPGTHPKVFQKTADALLDGNFSSFSNQGSRVQSARSSLRAIAAAEENASSHASFGEISGGDPPALTNN
eukprot:TRINITY_DN50710_c0_g1_i1.p1 TRINITY_DN50710_c0_g1~~TRINITY_DN50710_c0_g1_i1.p1  ORF type:complete len:885 (+),score=142.43 TRINITY_DN50710_c0_g1_i1:258-2912(+)